MQTGWSNRPTSSSPPVAPGWCSTRRCSSGALEAELVSADEGKERSLIARRDGGRHQIIAGDVSGPVGPRIVVDDLVSMSVSRTGHRVVAGTEHGVLVYDGFTGELVGEIPRPELQGVFVTLADQLFVSSLGGELTQYDLESMRPVRTFGGSRGYVQDLVGTSDGSLIAVRGGDRTVTLYDVATGVRLGAPIVVAEAQENLISLSPHGDRLAIGGGRTKQASKSGTSIPPTGWPRPAGSPDATSRVTSGRPTSATSPHTGPPALPSPSTAERHVGGRRRPWTYPECHGRRAMATHAADAPRKHRTCGGGVLEQRRQLSAAASGQTSARWSLAIRPEAR